MKNLLIKIPSTSPQEDRMTYVRAILHSLKVQREKDLPVDTADHNTYLLELATYLLPDGNEMMLLEQCLDRQKNKLT